MESERGQAELRELRARSGRPAAAVTPAILQRSDDLIRTNLRITRRQLASEHSLD